MAVASLVFSSASDFWMVSSKDAELGGGRAELHCHGYRLLFKLKDFGLGVGSGGLESIIPLLQHGVALLHKLVNYKQQTINNNNIQTT